MSTRSTLRKTGWLAPLCCWALGASIAHADVTFTVDTTDDRLDDDTSDGVCHTSVDTCGLRAAIMQANHLSAPGVTTIDVPSGIYTLTRPMAGPNGEDNGDLNLMTPLSFGQTIAIVGTGAANTIIDANGIDGVLHVDRRRVATLSGVTVRNGNRRVPTDGGGIVNRGGHLTLTDCVIEGNQTTGVGGGIANEGSTTTEGSLTLVRSTIRSNTAFFGGGIHSAVLATVRDSTIHGNGAIFGGGADVSSTGTLFATNSTISSNYAITDGGGVSNAGFSALYNTTVVNNDADHDQLNGGAGGGVFNSSTARFIVADSLIAENTRQNIRFYNDCNGLLEAYGRNYFFDLSGCNIPNPGSRLVTLSTFGPLQDNGGSTWTHALLPGSEAINTELFACVDESGAPLTADQRGAARTTGGPCDAGAFEYDGIASPSVIFESGFE